MVCPLYTKTAMITTIIFDWAGVFCSPGEPFTHPVFRDTLGLTPDEAGEAARDIQDLYYRGKITTKEFWEKIKERFGIDAAPEDLSRAYLASYVLDQEMIDFARNLRDSYKTVLLSNLTPEMTAHIAAKHAVRELFDLAIFSNEIGLIKPEPAIYEYALEASKTPPASVLFTDDSKKNVAAAAALGIRSLLFTTLPSFKESLLKEGVQF